MSGTSAERYSGRVSALFCIEGVSLSLALSLVESLQTGVATHSKVKGKGRWICQSPLLLCVLSFKGIRVTSFNLTQ